MKTLVKWFKRLQCVFMGHQTVTVISNLKKYHLYCKRCGTRWNDYMDWINNRSSYEIEKEITKLQTRYPPWMIRHSKRTPAERFGTPNQFVIDSRKGVS